MIAQMGEMMGRGTLVEIELGGCGVFSSANKVGNFIFSSVESLRKKQESMTPRA